ncbi:hypothetical protein DPMN_016272 [Dreissena polymorpha]|uniref:Reverse transcriptase n=1 Tax=Dreissena polymorpha TaxID=45954 RepID=A0A9D4NAY6_DREPO|nr:hypothetical protein DPMN_016272 [Dreissena polymorpha]
MTTSAEQKAEWNQWTLWKQLEGLDSALLGLTINREKSNVFRTDASNNTPITVQCEALEEVDSFTYLGSILDNQGGMGADVRIRHHKENTGLHHYLP